VLRILNAKLAAGLRNGTPENCAASFNAFKTIDEIDKAVSTLLEGCSGGG
jgi:hypothetical protein